MATLGTLPVELLLKILRLATLFDHPKALEYPLIRWEFSTDILFEYALELRRLSLVRFLTLPEW